MLTYKEKEHILSDFPNIELSYEIHKKVHEIFLTIPKGRKYFAWFQPRGRDAYLASEMEKRRMINCIH